MTAHQVDDIFEIVTLNRFGLFVIHLNTLKQQFLFAKQTFLQIQKTSEPESVLRSPEAKARLLEVNIRFLSGSWNFSEFVKKTWAANKTNNNTKFK